MSQVLTPVTVGQIRLRNRIAMPPMVRLAPHVAPELIHTDGDVTDGLLEHYASRSRAGTGLVIVEATCVDPGGRVWRQGLNAYDDQYADGLRALAMAICAGGAVAGIQLVHGGPQADPALTGGVTVGPSEVAPAVGEPEPVELTSAQVLEIEERFLAAAVRAANAGFEFIELHAAHGYLLDSFVSPIRNHRGDAFGGTMANRMRIISDILLRLKARLGGRAAVGARISVFNHIADGFGMADLQAMVRILQDCGSDFVDLSVDRALRRAFGAELTMGQVARGATQLPVLVAGGITTPVDAETVIAEGHGDIVCVGRAMLASADWSERAIRELPAPG